MAEILVVDDSREIRQLVSFSLRAAGYRILEAATGAEALAIINRQPPDLMILDVMMPGMTGFDVLRALKSSDPPFDFPVVLLTAKAELSDKTEGFESGASDYVTKPFAPKELVMRVATHLRAKDERDQLRHAAEGLQELSVTDELTGAYNRRHLTERIVQEFSEAARHTIPFSVLMMDIDHFKKVNDSYGHQAGDTVLCELVSRVRASIRKEDLIARYGGEEFVLLMPVTPGNEAAGLAERLRQNISASPFDVGSLHIPVTISVGVAAYPDDEAKSGEELVGIADKRLYVAKHMGRNRVIAPDITQASAA